MSKYILTISEPQATLENVGGKGASLARLAAAGLPVPGGFHITTAAYTQFVTANHLEAKIQAALGTADVAQPATLEAVAQTIREAFAANPKPADLAAEIAAAYAELGEPAVAVRSSATAEDLPELSFAGQQETYLNIQGIAAVQEAVQRCWGSLWTARAIGYRLQNGIDQQTVRLAVVVQRLIPAEAAGILFTANPITGKRSEAVINAAWGLGEAIVGGQVTPDTVKVDKLKGRVLRRETSEKKVMTIRKETGTEEQPVPTSKVRKAVLSDKQAIELTRYGSQIEALYGMPMDIEWTLAAGKFAIVQARPITALPEPPLEWPAPGPRIVLARGSFAEFLPDPVSPLFGTLATPIAAKTTQVMMNQIAGFDEPDWYIMEIIHGYFYIGIKMTFKVMWQMAIMSTVASKKILQAARERWEIVREEYLSVVRDWQKRDVARLTAADLLAGVREIFGLTAKYYTVIQSGTIPTSLSSEAVFGKFYSLLVKRKNEPAAPTFLFGSENQALRAEKSLFDIAAWIKETPPVQEAMRGESVGQISQRLSGLDDGSPWDELRGRFRAHLAEYGHSIYDLDFAKPVPADDPTVAVQAVKAYLDGTAANPYERQRAALDQREHLARTIVARLDPLRRNWFLRSLKWAQETAHLREDSIADIGLGYPQIRRMLGELGRRLTEAGAIPYAGDVYWLEAREADALAVALDQGNAPADFKETLEARKTEWRAMRKVTPPGVIPKSALISKLMPAESKHDHILKGIGASAGRITARACVLRGPDEFGQMQPGDVIVAVTTTPAWTPLFARAAAVVTDIGGPLSHSSIVAREYGIPAVLGTGAATRRIQNGQVIIVDGSAGTVTLRE